MRLRDFALLVMLAALWGASFLFIKVAVGEVEPLFLVTARTFLGVCTILILIPVLNRAAPQLAGFGFGRLAALWRPLLALGVVNSAIPFFFIAVGEQYIASSAAAILNSTTPLFAATLVLILPWLPEERLGSSGYVGLVVGLVGVGVLVGAGGSGVGGLPEFLGHLSILVAAGSYAIGGHCARAWMRDVPILVPAVGQNLGGFLVTLPFTAAFAMPDGCPGFLALAALLGLGAGSTGLAYIIYFQLIANVGATRTLMVTYLVPAFGIFYGTLLLGEEITAQKIAGLALILLGVAGVTGRLPLGRLIPRRRPGK